jgi:hypothetical protein
LTFVTSQLPYGFAFPELPSTHLFRYPDLGISIVNGFAAEQTGSSGISLAILVDPDTTDAPEIAAASKLLPSRGVFVRSYRGAGADVRSVADAIELFPYDLLIIATHCGDAPGYRWTYQFVDSEGYNRTLVVDIAIGIARTDDKDMLSVTQFTRFVSLDGVDWNDREKSKKLYVGTAITDYAERIQKENGFEPIARDVVPRVLGSAALRMFDYNYIALPQALAGNGTPIIINNACSSWHELSKRFTFGNARAYIGTLFMVSTSEAHDVVVKLLSRHFGKPLPAALWSAQREVYGCSVRRPYVATGVYPQRLRGSRCDVPQEVERRLAASLAGWQSDLRRETAAGNDAKGTKERFDYYSREIALFRSRWIRPR